MYDGVLVLTGSMLKFVTKGDTGPVPSSGVVQGIPRYTAYTHLFVSQHCVYPLLNAP